MAGRCLAQLGSIAAGYLVHALGAKPVAELPARGFFDIEKVEIKGGVVVPPHLPRNVLHHWKLPGGGAGPELLIFLSESQPSAENHEFALELLDVARRHNAERVITFASVASQMHPSQNPKVYGVVTQPDMKADVTRTGAEILQDGQIGGLNGVLLGAAAERGLPGICLLGEIPYFAGAVANPKAARAVLNAFTRLTGIQVDLEPLKQHDEKVDRVLNEMLERLKQQAEQAGADVEFPEAPDDVEEQDVDEQYEEVASETKPDIAARERIERLFEEAVQDRSHVKELKSELDNLGVFDLYEDRFLDLFKRAA